MVIRTFLDKCNTIVKDSEDNFGLNPILMLHYGGLISRILIYFNLDEIKDNLGNNYREFKHTLKMYNCGSIDDKKFSSTLSSFCGSGERKRANSFDIITFGIPEKWDSGIGFDSSLDYMLTGDASVSVDGSNWYQAYNGKKWGNEGIYTNSFISDEYTKFGNNLDSIIISRQHFNYGNENLEIDITNYVNDVIEGRIKNNGICLCFSPLLEDSFSEFTQYVGFFGKHTNTCFHPCIESRTNNKINDNRYDFTLGTDNNIYFFAEKNGEFIDLDETPTCTINEKKYEVNRVRKGCYCAKVKINKNEVESESILYDIWSNIKYEGEQLDDVEMEFVTHSLNDFFNIGKKTNTSKIYKPQITGINDYEKLIRGDKRSVIVYFRERYTNGNYKLFDNAEYRLYFKNIDKEYDVICWDKIEKMSSYNIFELNTNGLVPNTYFIDIRYKNNNDIITHKKCLEFQIINSDIINM